MVALKTGDSLFCGVMGALFLGRHIAVKSFKKSFFSTTNKKLLPPKNEGLIPQNVLK